MSYAAEHGDEATTKLLLYTNTVDINSKDENGRSPLAYAAGKGNEAAVKLLLDISSTDVNSKDNSNMAPLSHAANNNHESIVMMLSDRWNRDGRAASDWQADMFDPSMLHDPIVDILLEKGKLDIASQNGRSPLFWVARAGAKTIVELLLKSGKINVNAKDIFFWPHTVVMGY